MSANRKITDEEKMINKLEEHKRLVDLVQAAGRKCGVSVERTEGNDPRGDFRYPAGDQEKLVKELDRFFKDNKV